MFHYVYLLQCEVDTGFYVGYTNNLKKRFVEHNSGKNFSTKPAKPWKLIFYEAYLNRFDARRREKYLKTTQGSRALRRLLKEYFYHNKVG